MSGADSGRHGLINRYRAQAQRLLRNPDDAKALIEQFALLSDNGDKDAAECYLALAERAYLIDGNDIQVKFNYASALERCGQHHAAFVLYRECTNCEDEVWRASALHHAGITARALGRLNEAIEYYDRAIALNDNPLYRRDRALAIMASGRYREGMREFEVRKELALKRSKGPNPPVQCRLPDNAVHWNGEALSGLGIVVYHEEGSGDFIQFCRYIPRLREQGARRVLLTGPVPDLLEFIAPQIGADGIVPLAEAGCADYVVGSMSVPWRVDPLDPIDGSPYLSAEAAELPKRGDISVGLVWRGNPAFTRDHLRSMRLRDLAPLLAVPGAAFYSLQRDGSESIAQLGLDGVICDLSPHLYTWADTARYIAALDIVVSVDTAIAHLAGAMGIPVILLLPEVCDWRWARHRDRTDWYRSMITLRQPRHGDWRSCISRARAHIVERINERRQAIRRRAVGA
jgi:hypothetical protein